MSFASDLKILYHLALTRGRGDTHAERLENFYSGQAEGYDDFRRRLLHGRRELIESLELPEGGTWVDIGGGTGANLEFAGDRIDRLKRVVVVDLCDSLLGVARKRIAERGWKNVETLHADATRLDEAGFQADTITFSYSLTMIPDWFAAIDQAERLLAPGGQIGAVDFFVARKHPEDGRARNGWFTRTFWPAWFAADNVFLNPDHIPYLTRRFEVESLHELRAPVPYIPLLRVPYYRFVGSQRI